MYQGMKRQVRLAGGRFITQPIIRPQRVSVVQPIIPPVTQPEEQTASESAPKSRAPRTVKQLQVAQPIPTPAGVAPIFSGAIPSFTDKAESKRKRAEVLKAINDALTGKLKEPRQRGGFIRSLI